MTRIKLNRDCSDFEELISKVYSKKINSSLSMLPELFEENEEYSFMKISSSMNGSISKPLTERKLPSINRLVQSRGMINPFTKIHHRKYNFCRSSSLDMDNEMKEMKKGKLDTFLRGSKDSNLLLKSNLQTKKNHFRFHSNMRPSKLINNN